MKKILVTGGAGYIGSHTVKELVKKGYKDILVIDNLSKGKADSVVEPAKLKIADLSDIAGLAKIIKDFRPDVVMHFAASKDAAESVINPQKYYINNVVNSINLLQVMLEYEVKNIIFSSTAAVYGDIKEVPITEQAETLPINPYGWTKLIFEQILEDYHQAYDFNYISLRYFNAAGADVEGELGNMSEVRDDLISVLMQVANGDKKEFTINGCDFDTKDGSPVRDLIHVNDLAAAHVDALSYLKMTGKSEVINLGSEEGYTVKEAAFLTREVTGKSFEIKEGPKRSGDIIVSIASSKKAKELLGWQPKYSSLRTIIETSWNWEKGKNRL